MTTNRRCMQLAAGCLIMAAIGFIYGWSVFSVPLAQEFGWEPTVLSFTFTVLMWAFCAGGIVGARVAARTSTRTTLAIAAAGVFVAFALSALLMRQSTPWLLHAAYGGLGGCSVGMAYTATMGASVAWFPDKAGLASGALLLCYGASTLVLGSVATGLFAALGWRQAFVVLAAALALVMVAVSRTLRKPTDAEALTLPRPPSPTERNAAAQVGADRDTKGMLATPAFWSYAGWMLLVSCIGLGFIGSANQVTLESGASAAMAVGLVGLLSVCNGAGRLIGGLLFDALGTGRAMAVVAALHFLGCALATGALATTSALLMTAAVLVGGIGIGGVSALGSGFMAIAFGPRHYAENLSILNLVLIPAALTGPALMSTSVMLSGSYAPGTAALTAFGIAALALSALTGALARKLHRHR